MCPKAGQPTACHWLSCLLRIFFLSCDPVFRHKTSRRTPPPWDDQENANHDGQPLLSTLPKKERAYLASVLRYLCQQNIYKEESSKMQLLCLHEMYADAPYLPSRHKPENFPLAQHGQAHLSSSQEFRPLRSSAFSCYASQPACARSAITTMPEREIATCYTGQQNAKFRPCPRPVTNAGASWTSPFALPSSPSFSSFSPALARSHPHPPAPAPPSPSMSTQSV